MEQPAVNRRVTYDPAADIPNEAGQLTQPQPAIPGGGPANQMAPQRGIESAREAMIVVEGLASGGIDTAKARELLSEYAEANPAEWGQVQRWWNNKVQTEQRQKEVQETPTEKPKLLYNTKLSEVPGEMAKTALGTLDIIKSLAGSAVTEAVGGLHALGTMAADLQGLADGTYDFDESIARANEALETTQKSGEWITNPWSERGGEMMQMVAKPVMAADQWYRNVVDDLTAKHDPYGNVTTDAVTATILYATPMAFAELVGFGKIRKATPLTKSQLMKERADAIKQTAKDLGVSTKQGDMVSSIIDAAYSRAQGGRGIGMIELREAIVDLMQESAKARNKAEVTARGKYAAIRAGDVSEAAKALDMQLREAGYDLNKMEAAGQILQDLIDLPSQNPLMRGQRRFEGDEVVRAAETTDLIIPERLRREAQAKAAKSKEEVLAGLNEMWAIRNRAEKSMRPEKAFEGLNPGQNQNDVLRVIQQTIDDVIDSQFARDMMDGDPDAVAAWQAAHDIRKDFNRKFNEDKFINKMVNELDASPEQLRNALFGKSVTGPKDQAVATLRRMKRLLGEEHSAIKGITMDFVHELVQPLTADVPNFHQFIRQYDKLVRDNVTLVKEIGLDTTGLKELRDFAQMATRLPPGRQALMTPEFMATVISRYAFGHGIAKAGMTVSLWRRGISAMLGKDSISQRAILEELANTKFGEPAVQHGSIWRSRVAQAAILADWTETYLDAEDKVKEMKTRR